MDGAADQLSAPVRTKIATAAERGMVFVSAISVWEVAMLEARGRLTFSVECRDWVERALQAPGLQFVALSPAIAIDSTRLPGAIHSDPADRILVATARALNGTLITRDRALLDYSQGGYVKALNAA